MNLKAHIPQADPTTLPALLHLCKPHLILHQARLTCLLLLVLAVIKQLTVSLVWLSQNAESEAQQNSVYRRFQRFFAEYELPPKALGRLKEIKGTYIVRVKKNARIGAHSAAWLSERNRWKKYRDESHQVFEQEVSFSAKRIKKGRAKYLALISYGFHGQEALELYRLR